MSLRTASETYCPSKPFEVKAVPRAVREGGFSLTGVPSVPNAVGERPRPAYVLEIHSPARKVFEVAALALLEAIDRPSADAADLNTIEAYNTLLTAAADLVSAKRVAVLDGPRSTAVATEKRIATQREAQARLLREVASVIGLTPSTLVSLGANAVARLVGSVKPGITPPTTEQLIDLFERSEFRVADCDGGIGKESIEPQGIFILAQAQPLGTEVAEYRGEWLRTLADGSKAVANR